ncbi:hypothetical protein [Algibacter mikhailovii]|uniref:DUF4476 domain-containing protein n=1 Tax=Algibacter mikhailovii TaxID=425498 RepID=A0A918QYP3_9FLAO|nr:hypothetical protein [Algibacter mikhailovii]GGZ78751.1 hypothetical protein GCM10007028_15250 [Algibacter mikhailovii]
MKKVLLFTMAVAFTAVSSLSAQTMPSVKSTDLKKASTELSSSQTDQIKEALMKDKGLQEKTIDHLKSNPDTKDALMGLAAKNAGGLKGLMKSVLGDKSLSQAAVDFISKNPDLLQQAMKIVGM